MCQRSSSDVTVCALYGASRAPSCVRIFSSSSFMMKPSPTKTRRGGGSRGGGAAFGSTPSATFNAWRSCSCASRASKRSRSKLRATESLSPRSIARAIARSASTLGTSSAARRRASASDPSSPSGVTCAACSDRANASSCCVASCVAAAACSSSAARCRASAASLLPSSSESQRSIACRFEAPWSSFSALRFAGRSAAQAEHWRKESLSFKSVHVPQTHGIVQRGVCAREWFDVDPCDVRDG